MGTCFSAVPAFSIKLKDLQGIEEKDDPEKLHPSPNSSYLQQSSYE
jgi:hypothetical protein